MDIACAAIDAFVLYNTEYVNTAESEILDPKSIIPTWVPFFDIPTARSTEFNPFESRLTPSPLHRTMVILGGISDDTGMVTTCPPADVGGHVYRGPTFACFALINA